MLNELSKFILKFQVFQTIAQTQTRDQIDSFYLHDLSGVLNHLSWPIIGLPPGLGKESKFSEDRESVAQVKIYWIIDMC